MQLRLSSKKKKRTGSISVPLNLILHVGSATEIIDTNQFQSATGKQM